MLPETMKRLSAVTAMSPMASSCTDSGVPMGSPVSTFHRFMLCEPPVTKKRFRRLAARLPTGESTEMRPADGLPRLCVPDP
jgi:hypothetical protein